MATAGKALRELAVLRFTQVPYHTTPHDTAPHRTAPHHTPKLFLPAPQNDNTPCEVKPGLFIGSIGAARNAAELHRRGVTHVLSLLSADTPPEDSGVLWEHSPPHHAHLWIAIADDKHGRLAAALPRCIDFIEEGLQGGRGVLVHCFQGKSRSAAVVCAYLMRSEGATFDSALARVRSARPRAQPNLNFCLQLKRWERDAGKGTVPSAEEEHRQEGSL